MAEKGKKPKGGRRCVAGAPNKTSCGNNSHTEGITMHQFPTGPVVRAQWVRFVQKHRVDFGEPVNQYASLCSAHFEESCFTRNRSILEGMAASNVRRVLIKGSVPTTQLFPTGEEQNALLKATEESQSSQSKSSRKATNTCRTCKQPMRGHSKAKCQQNAGC